MSYLKYFLVTLSLAIISNRSTCQKNIDPEVQRKIDNYVENVFLPSAGISGLGLGIVKSDGEIFYTAGYGPANIEKGIENGNATQFLIASVTKGFTAVLTAKLLHETFPEMGETVLDTPIVKLMPHANFTLPDRFRSEHGTFRDLLAHRMCLFRGDLTQLSEAFNSSEELVYRTRYSEQICGIRSEFQYNNEMYVAAGGLAGILANKSFTEAVQEFMDDLEMVNSTVAKRTDDYSKMTNRAMPYYVMDGEMHPINPELVKRAHLALPAGGIFATPSDMTRYIRFHLNKGSLEGKQIVPREVMEWVHKPANLRYGHSYKATGDEKILSIFGYNLGLSLGSYDGWEYLEHGGYFPPYLSLLSIYPGFELGIFSSTHMQPRNVDASMLHAYIFEVLTGSDKPAENIEKLSRQLYLEKQEAKIRSEKKFNELYSNLVENGKLSMQWKVDISGQYGSGSLGDVLIYEKFNEVTNETQYYMEHGKWYHGWLIERVPNCIYQIEWATDVVQDDYVQGFKGDRTFAGFTDKTLTIFLMNEDDSRFVHGTFELGVRLDLLPPVPWESDSCG